MGKEIKDKVISFRVTEAELQSLENQRLEGESLNQAATRLFKEKVIGMQVHTNVDTTVNTVNSDNLLERLLDNEKLREILQTLVYNRMQVYEDSLSEHENTIQFLKTEVSFLKEQLQNNEQPEGRSDAPDRLLEAATPVSEWSEQENQKFTAATTKQVKKEKKLPQTQDDISSYFTNKAGDIRKQLIKESEITLTTDQVRLAMIEVFPDVKDWFGNPDTTKELKAILIKRASEFSKPQSWEDRAASILDEINEI